MPDIVPVLLGINFWAFANTEPAASKTKAQIEAKNLRRLAKTAEERLQSRLVDFKKLMIDVETGELKRMDNGELFTGKFVIPVPDGKFERLFHSKNGHPQASLVRLKGTNQKQWAIRKRQNEDIAKEFHQTGLSKAEEKQETIKMIEAGQDAADCMGHNYVIKRLLDSGDDFIMIRGNF